MCSRQQTETPGKDIHQNSSRKLTNSQGTAKKMLLHLINKLAMLTHQLTGHKKSESILSYMPIKRNEKYFICEVCGKVFTSASNLRKHIVTTVGRNHLLAPTCVNCGSSLIKTFQLKRHEMVHTALVQLIDQ